MSLNETERNILVKLEFERAQNILDEIEGLAQLKFWNNIANRLYYAAFHAVAALLIRDKRQVGTHKGAVIMFHQFYVKTGTFTTEEGRFYSQLQTMREESEYNCTYDVTEDDIVPKIEPARLFIGKIQKLIQGD